MFRTRTPFFACVNKKPRSYAVFSCLCYSGPMNAVLSPIVSEFETQETADRYDQWFRSKVRASLRLADDPNTPRYSTDEVARRMAQVIKAAETEHASRRLA